MNEKDRARYNIAKRSVTVGLFEALLLTQCIQRIESDHMKDVRQLVRVRELTEAFKLLTTLIVEEKQTVSEDAWAILQEIAGRIRARREDWHGLTHSSR